MANRALTDVEVEQLLSYIALLQVYLTDDHRTEMEEENEPEYTAVEALIGEISA